MKHRIIIHDSSDGTILQITVYGRPPDQGERVLPAVLLRPDRGAQVRRGGLLVRLQVGRGEAQQRDGGPRCPEDHPRHEGGHAGGVVIHSSALQMVLINQVHRK